MKKFFGVLTIVAILFLAFTVNTSANYGDFNSADIVKIDDTIVSNTKCDGTAKKECSKKCTETEKANCTKSADGKCCKSGETKSACCDKTNNASTTGSECKSAKKAKKSCNNR